MGTNDKHDLVEIEVDDDYGKECRECTRDWIFLVVITVIGVAFFLLLFGLAYLEHMEATAIDFEDKVATVKVGDSKHQYEVFDGVLVHWERCRFKHGK